MKSIEQLEQLAEILQDKIKQTNDDAIRIGLRMALIEVYGLMSKVLQA